MKPYHIGFGFEDLGSNPPKMVLLSGEPEIILDSKGAAVEKAIQVALKTAQSFSTVR